MPIMISDMIPEFSSEKLVCYCSEPANASSNILCALSGYFALIRTNFILTKQKLPLPVAILATGVVAASVTCLALYSLHKSYTN
jgi:hypothetical protein